MVKLFMVGSAFVQSILFPILQVYPFNLEDELLYEVVELNKQFFYLF